MGIPKRVENLTIQTILQTSAKMLRNAEFQNSPQLDLGTIIQKTELAEGLSDPGEKIFFDFGDSFPVGFFSYRGYYDELAITYADATLVQSTREEDAPTISDFLLALRQQVGRTHTGWKGGDYVMGLTTPVWVSNEGSVAHCIVVDVTYEMTFAIIHTRYSGR